MSEVTEAEKRADHALMAGLDAANKDLIAVSSVVPTEKGHYMGIGQSPQDLSILENAIKQQGLQEGVDYKIKPSSLNEGRNIIALTMQGATRIEQMQTEHQAKLTLNNDLDTANKKLISASPVIDTEKGAYMGVGLAAEDLSVLEKSIKQQGFQEGVDYKIKPSSLNEGRNIIALTMQGASRVAVIKSADVVGEFVKPVTADPSIENKKLLATAPSIDTDRGLYLGVEASPKDFEAMHGALKQQGFKEGVDYSIKSSSLNHGNNVIALTAQGANKISSIQAEYHTPAAPVAEKKQGLSKEAVAQIQQFNSQHRLDESAPIAYGYKDGGRQAKYDDAGEAIVQSNRETIVVKDPKDDPTLKRTIETARRDMAGMTSAEQKANYLNNLVAKLMPNTDESFFERAAEANGPKKQVSLGELIEIEAGVCRHRSLLFKVLADHTGVESALIRGRFDNGEIAGAHAWNEVKLEDGKRLLVDVMHGHISDMSDPYVRHYNDTTNKPMYDNHGVIPRENRVAANANNVQGNKAAPLAEAYANNKKLVASAPSINTEKGVYLGVGATEHEFSTLHEALKQQGFKEGVDFHVKSSTVNNGNNVIALSPLGEARVSQMQTDLNIEPQRAIKPQPAVVLSAPASPASPTVDEAEVRARQKISDPGHNSTPEAQRKIIAEAQLTYTDRGIYMGVGANNNEVNSLQDTLRKKGFQEGIDYNIKASSLNQGGNVIVLSQQGQDRVSLIQHDQHFQNLKSATLLATSPVTGVEKNGRGMLYMGVGSTPAEVDVMHQALRQQGFEEGIDYHLKPSSLNQGGNVISFSDEGTAKLNTLQDRHQAQTGRTLAGAEPTQHGALDSTSHSSNGRQNNGSGISVVASATPLSQSPHSNGASINASMQNQPLPHNSIPIAGNVALAPQPQVQLNLEPAPANKPIVNPTNSAPAANAPSMASPPSANDPKMQAPPTAPTSSTPPPSTAPSPDTGEPHGPSKTSGGGGTTKIEGHTKVAGSGVGIGMGIYGLTQKFGEDGTATKDLNNKDTRTMAQAGIIADVGAIAADTAELASLQKASSGLKTASRITRVAAPVGVALAVASGVIDYKIAEKTKDAARASDAVGGTAGGMAGAAAGGIVGAKTGAAIGAAVGVWFGGIGAAPGAVVGGFVGGIVGAVGGAFVGAEAGKKVAEVTIKDSIQKKYDEEKRVEATAQAKGLNKADLAKSIQQDSLLPHKLNLRGQEVTLVQAMEDKTFRTTLIKNMEAEAKKNPALDKSVVALKEYGTRLDTEAAKAQAAAVKPAATTTPATASAKPTLSAAAVVADAQYKSMGTTQLASIIQKDTTLPDTVKIGQKDVLLCDALKDKKFRDTFLDNLEKADAKGSDLHAQIAMVKAYETALTEQAKAPTTAGPAVQVAQQNPKLAAQAMV